MDSRASRDFLFSSDEEGEEEMFASFTVEEIDSCENNRGEKRCYLLAKTTIQALKMGT